MSESFANKIRWNLEGLGALTQDRFLIALSGGGDSTALILALCDITSRDNLVAAHLDHNVRSGSGKDKEKVELLCRDLGVDCISHQLTVGDVEIERKRCGSMEGALRTLRYRFLENASISGGTDWILTGHSYNDQAETAVFRVTRNMNWRSLVAIPGKRGKILRPMLDISNVQARDFCKSWGVRFLEDPSNQENSFTRNRIRNITIPALKDSFHPDLDELANRLVSGVTGLLAAEKRLLDTLFIQQEAQHGRFSLNMADLKELPLFLQEGAVLEFLESGLGKFPSTSLLNNVMQFLLPEGSGWSEGSGSIDLPGGSRLRVSYEKVVMLKEKHGITGMPETVVPLAVPGRTGFYGSAFSIVAERGKYPVDMHDFPAGSAFLSADKAGDRLWARRRKAGDRFMPLGMDREKKVKELLIDRKVPVYERDNIPMVLDNEGTILWVGGVEISQKGALEMVEGEEIIILKLEMGELGNGNPETAG